MLKFIIFLLVFNVLCFAEVQDFDIYEISDRKSVAKRDIDIEPIQQDKQPPQNVIPQRPKKFESVKKVLNQKENSESTASNSQNTQTLSKNDTHEQKIEVDASKNQTETEPKDQKAKSAVPALQDDKNADSNSTKPAVKKAEHPGATLRGFYVFLGLSFLILIYFIFKAFRLRPGAPPPTTVRKYGIVGRRSDMEMLPLPLAEEEDDDTLFDMGTQINR